VQQANKNEQEFEELRRKNRVAYNCVSSKVYWLVQYTRSSIQSRSCGLSMTMSVLSYDYDCLLTPSSDIIHFNSYRDLHQSILGPMTDGATPATKMLNIIEAL
jgi:hypothetical protein